MNMNQSPKHVVDTDEFYLVDTILGGTTITAVDVHIYLGSTDKTYECTTGNTQEFIRNTYTTNTIYNLRGGNTYILVARITIDGEVVTRKCKIIVQKESDLQ